MDLDIDIGHRYSKHGKCHSMVMLFCIKQHLSNIWSSVHEKVKKSTEAGLGVYIWQ